MKNKKEDRRVLVAILLSTVVIASVLIYSFAAPRNSDQYFPLWITDQNHLAPPRTMNVTANQSYIFYLGAQNEMKEEEDCILMVKLRNITQPVPVTSNLTSSDLPTLRNYTFLLKNGEQWETQFNFTLFGRTVDNSFSIQQITIDNVSVSPALHINWDTVSKGFYFQFVYELWLLSRNSGEFYFSGVWISSPLLNATQ